MQIPRDELKQRVNAAVEGRRQELIDLSLRIHNHPEVAFQESQAAAWLGDYLEAAGFAVERGICDIPTAFRATYGSGRPYIAFLSEYDALPGLGHGCGHNIIAAIGIGAGIGLKQVMPPLEGTVAVIGTPAEEAAGGKVFMAQRGAFDGLDAALMAHPGSADLALARSLALAELWVEYFGKEAHAAARPEEGINALDAMIIAYNAVSALRQQTRDSARIHGIITDGGQAVNVIPAHSAARFLIRAEDDVYLETIKEKVLACFRAGAEATGARLEYRWDEAQYAAVRNNRPLADAYRRNLESLGRRVVDREDRRPMGSTDMGNVSRIVPAIHPTIGIAPSSVSIHTVEFREVAASEAGHSGLIDAAKALAMTGVDFLAGDDMRRRVAEAFMDDKG